MVQNAFTNVLKFKISVEGNASRLPTFGNYDSIHIQHLFSPLALNAFRRPWASYNAYYNNSESDFKL